MRAHEGRGADDIYFCSRGGGHAGHTHTCIRPVVRVRFEVRSQHRTNRTFGLRMGLGGGIYGQTGHVWAGGLGVKELGKPDPVGPDTLFIAASIAKALTTLLLAELVDEGKMRWDQPVTELFPAFKLGDEATTKWPPDGPVVSRITGPLVVRRERRLLLTRYVG